MHWHHTHWHSLSTPYPAGGIYYGGAPLPRQWLLWEAAGELAPQGFFPLPDVGGDDAHSVFDCRRRTIEFFLHQDGLWLRRMKPSLDTRDGPPMKMRRSPSGISFRKMSDLWWTFEFE